MTIKETNVVPKIKYSIIKIIRIKKLQSKCGYFSAITFASATGTSLQVTKSNAAF